MPRAKLAVLLLLFFSFPPSSSYSLPNSPRGKVELQQDSVVPTETGETVLPWQRGIACWSGEPLHSFASLLSYHSTSHSFLSSVNLEVVSL